MASGKLSEKVNDVLENNGWKLCSVEKQDGEYWAEIENWSPAGEDLVETIWFDGTSKGFCRAVAEYAADFDPDEHAELYVNMRGERGVPNSIRALINDADAIADMLDTLADELGKLY